MVPPAAEAQRTGLPSTINPNDLQTKVLQDSKGNVHVLWVVPALNNSASGPGIWYSRYNPNGTDTIPITRITNSTTIQSADLAVDGNANAFIIWAEDITPPSPLSSALYIVHFNSTQEQSSRILSERGSLILWPSLATGDNESVYITWTEYDTVKSQARVEYGSLTPTGSIVPRQLASYERADAFTPQPHLIFDNSSQHIQVAWGESEKDGKSSSTVNYTKLGTNGTVLTQLQVAKFAATLQQVTMSGMDGNDGAFILWQTTGSNNSLYVSQISRNGTLVYVKQLNSPTSGQSRYIAVSTDSSNNLYVVWYHPSAIAPQNSNSSESTNTANMTYIRMSVTGVIDQTGSGVFRAQIWGVAVLNDGAVYGLSPNGLVGIVTPTKKQTSILSLTVISLMSCISAAGFAGSLLLEEGRYRWVALYGRMIGRLNRKSTPLNQEAIKLLARKPGLRLRDLRGLTGARSVNATTLVAMEKNGYVASFRDGLSRRFYVKDDVGNQTHALRTRILLWVANHPGIWEAQLAKDLRLSQQIVHYHLKKLRDSKLITTVVDSNGGRKLYRFVDSAVDKHPSPDL